MSIIDFHKYDKQNPEIWRQFERFAMQAWSKGFKHYSAKGIFELIRWHTKTAGKDGFKVNNNYHADYARKMMRLHPEFEGFFRTRQTKATRRMPEGKQGSLIEG